jgi:Mitochondrial import protein Pam17
MECSPSPVSVSPYDFLPIQPIPDLAVPGVGAIAGPSVGGALWRWRHSKQLAAIDEKDKEFLKHIAKNRVDASLQSPTAPVPDYYGERIGSLHGYRQVGLSLSFINSGTQ